MIPAISKTKNVIGICDLQYREFKNIIVISHIHSRPKVSTELEVLDERTSKLIEVAEDKPTPTENTQHP